MRTHTKKERPNTNTHMHTYAGIDEANVKEEYFITRTLLQTLLQTFFFTDFTTDAGIDEANVKEDGQGAAGIRAHVHTHTHKHTHTNIHMHACTQIKRVSKKMEILMKENSRIGDRVERLAAQVCARR